MENSKRISNLCEHYIYNNECKGCLQNLIKDQGSIIDSLMTRWDLMYEWGSDKTKSKMFQIDQEIFLLRRK